MIEIHENLQQAERKNHDKPPYHKVLLLEALRADGSNKKNKALAQRALLTTIRKHNHPYDPNKGKNDSDHTKTRSKISRFKLGTTLFRKTAQ